MSAVADVPYQQGTKLTRGDGSSLRVGRLLAKGAEGRVYEVLGAPDLVLKEFTRAKLAREPELQSRLAAMLVARPPRWRERRTGHVLFTWPQDVARDADRFVGYVMPRIDTAQAVEVHVVSNASDRRAPDPRTAQWVRGFTWEYLVQTASNLALATNVLHASGCVIGDFNDRNILVSKSALVTLVDCDSMQVPRPHDGAYLCQVGRSEFNAPELAAMDLARVGRAPSSDLFPLAVHIHQLLLEGVHPFDGVWHGAGEKPKRHVLARQGLYVYGGNRRLTPHELWMSFELVPKHVRDLFARAFVDGARDPSRRPTGAEWHATLLAMQAHLCTCKRKQHHVYADHLPSCPWCDQERRVRAAEQRPSRPASASGGSVARESAAAFTRRRGAGGHEAVAVGRRPGVAALPAKRVRNRLNRPLVWISALVAFAALVLVVSSKGGSGTPSAAGVSPPAQATPPSPDRPTAASTSSGGSTSSARVLRKHTAASASSSNSNNNNSRTTSRSTVPQQQSHRSSASDRSHESAPSTAAGSLGGSAAPSQSAPSSSSSGLSGAVEHETPTPKSTPQSSGGGLSGSANGEAGSDLSGSASH